MTSQRHVSIVLNIFSSVSENKSLSKGHSRQSSEMPESDSKIYQIAVLNKFKLSARALDCLIIDLFFAIWSSPSASAATDAFVFFVIFVAGTWAFLWPVLIETSKWQRFCFLFNVHYRTNMWLSRPQQDSLWLHEHAKKRGKAAKARGIPGLQSMLHIIQKGNGKKKLKSQTDTEGAAGCQLSMLTCHNLLAQSH